VDHQLQIPQQETHKDDQETEQLGACPSTRFAHRPERYLDRGAILVESFDVIGRAISQIARYGPDEKDVLASFGLLVGDTESEREVQLPLDTLVHHVLRPVENRGGKFSAIWFPPQMTVRATGSSATSRSIDYLGLNPRSSDIE